MAIRKCPVCRVGEIRRYDIKTCSPICSRTWATWGPETRHKATYDAEHGLEDQMAKILEAKRREGAFNEQDEERASSDKPYEKPEPKTFDLDAILGKLDGLSKEDKLKAMLPAGEDLTDEDRQLIEEHEVDKLKKKAEVK